MSNCQNLYFKFRIVKRSFYPILIFGCPLVKNEGSESRIIIMYSLTLKKSPPLLNQQSCNNMVRRKKNAQKNAPFATNGSASDFSESEIPPNLPFSIIGHSARPMRQHQPPRPQKRRHNTSPVRRTGLDDYPPVKLTYRLEYPHFQ